MTVGKLVGFIILIISILILSSINSIASFSNYYTAELENMESHPRSSNSTSNSTDTVIDFYVGWDIDPWMEDPDDPRKGQKYNQISPAATEKFKILIKNLGNVNDTYDLSLTGLLKGWNAYFTENRLNTYSVSLDAKSYETCSDYKGSETEIDVYITVPANAWRNDISQIKIIGFSRFSINNLSLEDIYREDILIVEVKIPCDPIELTCDDPQKYIDPGSNLTFIIEIRIIERTNVMVELNHTNFLPEGWKVDYPKLVYGSKSSLTKISIVIAAPFHSPRGNKCIVTIRGNIVSEGLSWASDTQTLVAIVGPDYCPPELDISPYTHTVDPGESVESTIKVSNQANCDDFVILSPFKLKPEWGDAVFIYKGQEFYNYIQIHLDYTEKITVKLKLLIPENELAGTYHPVFNVTDLKNTFLLRIEVIVNQTYDLSIFVHDEEKNEFVDQIEIDASPGWELSYLFKLTNNGNGPDIIKLESEDLGLKFDTYYIWHFHAITIENIYTTNFEYLDLSNIIFISDLSKNMVYLNNDLNLNNISLLLNARQVVYISINIRIPTVNEEKLSDHFVLKCTSTRPDLEDSFNNNVSLYFNFLYPDLVIDRIYYQKSPIEGEIVVISTYIKNIGDIEARNINVALFIDGKLVRSAIVVRIPNGTDDLLVSYNWQASRGSHEITIEIDPYNSILERNDQFCGFDNNCATKKIISDESNPVSIQVIGFIFYIIILAMIISTIILIIQVSKKKFGKSNSINVF